MCYTGAQGCIDELLFVIQTFIILQFGYVSPDQDLQAEAFMVAKHADKYYESVFGFTLNGSKKPGQRSIRFPVSLEKCGEDLYKNSVRIRINSSSIRK